MDATSALLALKALDGLDARAVVTAENIANAGTPGYRPMRVDFETALAQAASRGPQAIAEVRPTTSLAPGAGADGLRLDLEMATASSTAMRYGALIEVLSRQMQLNALAVSGGR